MSDDRWFATVDDFCVSVHFKSPWDIASSISNGFTDRGLAKDRHFHFPERFTSYDRESFIFDYSPCVWISRSFHIDTSQFLSPSAFSQGSALYLDWSGAVCEAGMSDAVYSAFGEKGFTDYEAALHHSFHPRWSIMEAQLAAKIISLCRYKESDWALIRYSGHTSESTSDNLSGETIFVDSDFTGNDVWFQEWRESSYASDYTSGAWSGTYHESTLYGFDTFSAASLDTTYPAYDDRLTVHVSLCANPQAEIDTDGVQTSMRLPSWNFFAAISGGTQVAMPVFPSAGTPSPPAGKSNAYEERRLVDAEVSGGYIGVQQTPTMSAITDWNNTYSTFA